VVKSSPSFGDSGGVGEHADGPLDFGQVTTWDGGWWLVVDTDFETGWAPVDELDGPLGFDGGNGSVDVFGDDITSVQEAAGHVLTVSGVAFDHLVGWFKASVGDFSNSELFVVSFLGRDDWSIGGQRKVNPWVWDQVGLELGQVDVESTIESEGSGDGRDDLSNKPIQVGVSRPFNIQIPSADIIDGFIVNHESAVRVFQSGMGGEDRVVRFNNSGRNLGSWVDSEFKFGFLAVVNGEPFHQQRGETRTGTTTEGVEQEETLKTGTLVSQFSYPVEDEVDEFFTDSVVASSVVVSGIFLTSDQLFRVE